MTKRALLTTEYSSPGVTLTEYAILIALIAGLSFVGLTVLGNSTSDLLTNSAKTLTSNTTISVLSPINQPSSPSASNGQWINTSNNTNAVDPLTGQPMLPLANTTAGSGTNVSSSEGMQKTLGTFKTAETLMEMAEAQTEPVAQDYYQRLAELTYYMAGTQGVMSDIDTLKISEQLSPSGKEAYTPANALDDLIIYKAEIQELIKNPPAGVSKQAVNKVKPLVNSSTTIAQTYITENQEFIVETKKGTQIDAEINTVLASDEPAVTNSKGKAKKLKITKSTYDQHRSLAQMQGIAKQMINDNKVESASVETTLENGVAIDPTLTPTTP